MGVKIKNTTFIGNENVCKLTGQQFRSYLGIPYAEPPIGELRFQPPKKFADYEDDEFDATIESDDCIQTSLIKTGTNGSEDCLYLNVHVPKNNDDDDTPEEESQKPVVVFVHGGMFNYMSGSPSNYAPDYLVSCNVIVVTFNYRLNIFGFLDLGLPQCPGNVGLLDIVMAFQWVKENIRCFGGDPNNVTAFGNSSGAFAVHLLTMSPLTKGLDLFNKMILISGNAMSPLLSKVNSQETAFDIGYRLGYRGQNRDALLKFLNNASSDELLETLTAYCNHHKMIHKGDVFYLPFLPTIQKYKEAGAIIPQHPARMIKTAKKYPTLAGMMNKEGLMAYFLEPFVLKDLVEDFAGVVKRITQTDGSAAERVTELIKSTYFNHNELIGYNHFPESIDFFTDIYWTRFFYEGLAPLTEASPDCPVYIFEFRYDGALNCYKKYYPVLTRWIEGATHDDMLGYCLPFKNDLGSRFTNKRDIKMINYISTALCNFISKDDPNGDPLKIKWKASTNEEPCYLQIEDTLKLTPGKINQKRAEIWKRIGRIIGQNCANDSTDDEVDE